MQFNLYSLGFLIAVVFMVYLIRLTYGNPRLVPYKEFKIILWLFLLANIFMFAAMTASNTTVAYVFHEMKFICIFVTPLMYVFCYKLNGIVRKNYRRIYAILGIVPAAVLIGIATNPLHHWFCVSYSSDLVGSQVYLTVVRGPLFMIHSIYSFGLSALTVIVQLVALRKLPRGHRVTSYFLLGGLAANVGVTIYSAFGGAKYGDPGVLVLPLFATLMYIGMIMKPNIVLNAANRITVENMKSCTLFFDLDKTLISANEAARELFGLSQKSYGALMEQDFFRNMLGISYTSRYTEPEFSLGGKYFQIDDHHLTDETGLVCGRAIVLTDITDLRNTVNDMEYALNHDALTGILNHVALLKRVEQGFEPPVSFIACGIRGMKMINNLLGYEYGDTVLVKATEHLRAICDGIGICARFAGDVFVVVLYKTDEARAREIINDLQSRLDDDTSLYVPIRMWFGEQTMKKQGELPEQVMSAAFDELSHAKLMSVSDDISLGILQHAQMRAGIINAEKSGMVVELCLGAGRALGLCESELMRLDMLAKVYDVGLVSTSKELLTQRGHFSNEQWRDYKLHIERGYRIARLSPLTLPIANELLAHHEHFDGRGYPNRLKGESIPFLARILSAGIFLTDLMYDDGIPRAEALGKLKALAGTQFDPAVAKAFADSAAVMVNKELKK